MEFSKTYYIGTFSDVKEISKTEYKGFKIEYRNGDNDKRFLYTKKHPHTWRGNPNAIVVNTVIDESLILFTDNVISIKEGKINEYTYDNSEEASQDKSRQILSQIITVFYFCGPNDTVKYSEKLYPTNSLSSCERFVKEILKEQ